MAETQEQIAAQIDAAEADASQSGSEGASNGVGGQSNSQQQLANMDPAELKAFMEEFRASKNEDKQWRNQLNSRLGNYDKKTSELDKYLAQQNKPQTPASWSKLDEATKAATKEIVQAAWEEKYGDDWKSFGEVKQSFQERQENDRVEGLCHRILGAEYSKYDEALGNIYTQVKQAAAQGDPGATGFLKEIRTTESGVYRMVQLAQAEVSKNLNTQSAQATQELSAKSGKAAKGVGGNSRTTTNSKLRADGLPDDKAERQAFLAAKLDEYDQQQQG